jgi:DNA-binding CsgD family transcriptional regulator
VRGTAATFDTTAHVGARARLSPRPGGHEKSYYYDYACPVRESLPGGAFDARHGALPPSIVRWIRRQTGRSAELPRAREPFVMTRDATQLVARIVSRGAETLVVLEEQHRWIPPAALRSLGLTRRETEVLAWVAEGKTSAEIANILGTGRRAIEKHLEHIYPKLGVETRTAAAARALAQLTNSTRPA